MATAAYALYTARPAAGPLRSFRDFLLAEYQQPVHLLGLEHLRPPAGVRRPQLLVERGQLTEQLDSVRFLLGVARQHPGRFPQEEQVLQADEQRLTQRLQAIAAALGNVPPSP
ncbi:hypothetical protein [Hymenobacter rigui]|uniref:Uncharacterized protein n=1 Tax=Hymenobacter rigui TaxID=334424 RepID=A0A3R9PSY9_9BACT|nr:hypothetical protein [Hymenobacter rigui]RSK45198.1 hypothetical protein EI291_18985 [Hymenobacter rigui]